MELSFPPCLTATPQALVAWVGLLDWPEIHAQLVQSRDPDRVPLHFISGDDLNWPEPKVKRSNYEFFIPKGILKANWMDKHLYRLPSVVVIFMELDWSGPNFAEKKAECASRVQSVRATLAGRSTKLAVVLIQKSASSLAEDEAVASEKAASLCSECEISTRSLFVLPVRDENLKGYILRLETAFHELSQNYYHQEIRGVKAHRDYLNKTTHLYLFVRHQFKAGFLNELKRDYHASYKHYCQAYSLLMEVRATDTNIMEVKTVAGFISYKICKLAFRLNLPRDAISQFRKHMDIFQQKVGMDDLGFEHKGWQSKQCAYFAQIFVVAIQNGLPAIQTQHPGLYFQQAAQYAISRRELAEELCAELKAYPSPDPLEHKDHLEFYGQRPWRPGKVALEAPDMESESAGVQALLHHEKHRINHSQIIIALLDMAIEQFKVYKSPRSESHLRVTMAEELKSAQQYREALELLHPVMIHYRKEGWRPLLDAVLSLGVKCAFLLVDMPEYLRLCLDLASKESQASPEEKQRIMQNVARLFDEGQPKLPGAEPGLTSKSERAAVGEATQKWAEELKTSPRVTVDLGENPSAILLKTLFVSPVCKADDVVTFEVFVQNGSPSPIPLTHLEVVTSSKNYTLLWDGCELIEPRRTFEKRFTFRPELKDVNSSIHVQSVQAHFGHQSEKSFQITLISSKSSKPKKDYPFQASFLIPPKPKVVMPLSGEEVDGANFEIDLLDENPVVMIKQRDPLLQMKLEYRAPILVGEWFEVQIHLDNQETESDAKAVEIHANLVESQDPLIVDTTQLTFNPEGHEAELKTPSAEDKTILEPLVFRVGDLKPSEARTIKVYLKASTTALRNVTIGTKYSVALDHGQPSQCESQLLEVIRLDTIDPFALEYSIQSIRMNAIKKVFTNEAFLVSPQVKSMANHGITILDSAVEIRHPLHLVAPTVSQLADTTFQKASIGREIYPILVKREDLVTGLDVQELALGKYVLRWCREGFEDQSHLASSTSFSLPTVPVHLGSLFVSMDLPAFGVARTPMTLTYHFHNRTDKVQDYSLLIDAGEEFMMSGNKQLNFKLFPMRKHSLNYVLYPLVAGDNIRLPEVKLASTRVAQVQDANEVLERLLPKSIVILPKARGKHSEDQIDQGQQNEGKTHFGKVNVVIVKNDPFKMGAKLKVASS